MTPRAAFRKVVTTPEMHVLIVNQYGLPAGAAGITRHGDLGHELVKRGHRVTVIASRFNYLTRSDPGRAKSEDLHGVTFRWMQTGTYAANDSRRTRSMILFTLRAVVVGISLQSRPNVVIGSSPHLLAGISAWFIARRYRVPFLFEIRDPWPSALVDLGAVRAGSITHRLLERIERFLYRRAARIITVMSHADLRVAEVGEDPRKCVHIPNASSAYLAPETTPSSLDALMASESTDGRCIVLYTGAHGVSNGLNGVIDAIDMLRREAPRQYERLALFFVGDGPEREKLAARAADSGHRHIHFKEAVPKAAVMTAMTKSDFVLVHFAKADFKRFGMSANKLYDAMAVARPVLIATPLTDTPVDEVGCGLRYEPGSTQSLVDALVQAIEMPFAERDAMGQRGRAEMESRYNLEITGEQLERLLTAVAGLNRADRLSGPRQ